MTTLNELCEMFPAQGESGSVALAVAALWEVQREIQAIQVAHHKALEEYKAELATTREALDALKKQVAALEAPSERRSWLP